MDQFEDFKKLYEINLAWYFECYRMTLKYKNTQEDMDFNPINLDKIVYMLYKKTCDDFACGGK